MSEHYLGCKAALVLLQQRWCLAQGHISLEKWWSLIVISSGMHSWQPESLQRYRESLQRYRSAASCPNACLCHITCSLLRLTLLLFLCPELLSLRTTYFSFQLQISSASTYWWEVELRFHLVYLQTTVCIVFGRLFYAIVVVASIVMLFFSRHSVLCVWYGHPFNKSLI